MTTLNRKRYQIAELIENLGRSYQRTSEQVAADACGEAGLEARVVIGDGQHPFVAVSAHPDVDFIEFVAIEPAAYSTPDRHGWRVWWRRTDGKEPFRHGDPVETGVWCTTVTEAIEIAARYQLPQF